LARDRHDTRIVIAPEVFPCPGGISRTVMSRLLACAGFLCALLAQFVGVPPAQAHGDLDLQIEAVGRDIRRSPNEARLYLKRAELHRLHAAPEAALADLAVARQLDPKLVDIDFAEGRALLTAERFAEAHSALDRFIAVQPDHPIALWFRAQALMHLDLRAAADADLKRCIEVAPHPSPELILARAHNLEAAVQLPMALQVLHDAMESLGPVYSLQLAAVDLEGKLGRTQAALHRLDGLIATSPRPESLLVRKAIVLTKAGQVTAARAAYQAAKQALADLPPTTQKTLNNRALAEQIEKALLELGDQTGKPTASN